MSSMTINQNILSIKTHSQLVQTSSRLEKSIEKLSSGLRINRAADDAAGLAISEKLRRQVRGLSRAILNAQDGISMVQSAEGALGESQSNIQRMRELAVQASNDTLTSNDRLEIQKEVNQLRDDLDRIANNTDFNTKKLLDGSQTALISANSKYVKGLVSSETVAGDFEVSLALQTAGTSEMLRSQIFTNKYTGDLASGGETLLSISQFYDNNGTFVVSSPKTVTINSNGKQTEFKVDSGYTLGDLTDLINNGMRNAMELDQVNASTKYKTPTLGKDGGYIQITSGVIGTEGKLNFSGDQSLITALGLSTVREAADNVIKATAMAQDGNQTTVQTSTSRVSGLLEGVDITFDSQAGQVAGFQGIESGLSITAAMTIDISIFNTTGTATLSTSFTIASGTWTLRGLQRAIQLEIDTDAIGDSELSGLKADIVNGQIKISHTPASSSINSNMQITSTIAEMGSIGIADGMYASSVTGSKNTDNVIEGVTRFDGSGAAGGAITLNAGDGSFASGATTLMTTVTVENLVDMVTLQSLTNLVNGAAAGGTVEIRADRVGDSLAFTSTRIGTQTTVGGVESKSMVSLVWGGGSAAGTTAFLDKLGIDSANTTTRAEGKGDTNFRLHVVSNTPQFHIGSDQGQTMVVTMGNMGSASLGVDKLDMTSIEGAAVAMGKINDALDRISGERSKYGAYQNRLEYAINNLRNMYSNMTSAESRIRDVDVAQEMIEFTRDQIVNQSGTAMLAQANLVPQGVLTLLR